MNDSIPQYRLFSETCGDQESGRWRFVLRAEDGSERIEAEETESGVGGQRLELLSVVRGLEALDQPASVTLMTPSRYIQEGIRYGLSQWRRNDWCWESFGRMVPVKHSDLWQRVDRALQFHRVECRIWRVDPPHVSPLAPAGAAMIRRGAPTPAARPWRRLPFRWARRLVAIRRRTDRIRNWLGNRGTAVWERFAPCPHVG